MTGFRAFLLPTREDVAAIDAGRKPENVLWQEFDSAAEKEAYASGIDAVEDEFDSIDTIEVVGVVVKVGRGSVVQPHKFGTSAEARAFKRGIEDADGFHAPLLIDEEDPRFVALEKMGCIPSIPAGRTI